MRLECVLGWQRLPDRSAALIRETKRRGLEPIRFRPTVIAAATTGSRVEPKPKKRRKRSLSPQKPPTSSAVVLPFKLKAANQN
jgi:hypothetical protein